MMVWLAWLAGCDGAEKTGSHSTFPATEPPTGTGPATGVWDGSCSGAFTVTTTTGGSSLPIVVTDEQDYDLDPASLRLSDNGAVEGTFTFVRADLGQTDADSYRVQGTRSGTTLSLRLIGFATTSSTVPTTVTGIFPFSLELGVGAELEGDLIVSDGPDELGRVPCTFR